MPADIHAWKLLRRAPNEYQCVRCGHVSVDLGEVPMPPCVAPAVDPQDTTYGSDADLLEERGNMWKARAEKAERERDYFKNLCVEGGYEMRRRLDGAAQVGADALARMHAAEMEVAALREAAELREMSATRADARIAAAVLREREECALIADAYAQEERDAAGCQACDRAEKTAVAIRARSK